MCCRHYTKIKDELFLHRHFKDDDLGGCTVSDVCEGGFLFLSIHTQLFPINR